MGRRIHVSQTLSREGIDKENPGSPTRPGKCADFLMTSIGEEQKCPPNHLPQIPSPRKGPSTQLKRTNSTQRSSSSKNDPCEDCSASVSLWYMVSCRCNVACVSQQLTQSKAAHDSHSAPVAQKAMAVSSSPSILRHIADCNLPF